MGAVTSAPVEESSPPRSNRKKWMEELSKRKPEFNKLKLHQMALPGTHNSATYHIEHKYNYTSELARCQQHDVLTQLNSGVRVLDLRICDDCSEGVLKISHRFHGVNLGEVLHQIYTFLSDNQGEIVLVNIKKDFDRELSEEGIKKASEMIKNYFGNMIIDNFKVYEFGYEELIYKKLRIHFFSETLEKEISVSEIETTWCHSNSSEIEELMFNIEKHYHSDKINTFKAYDCYLTATIESITKWSLKNINWHQLQKDTNYKVLDWLQKKTEDNREHKINIVFLDMINQDLIDFIILLNPNQNPPN